MGIRALISNMQLRSKLFFMVIMLVIMLVGLGGYGFWLLSDNAQKLGMVQNGALKQTDEIIAFHRHAMKSAIGLYKLVTATNIEIDRKKIAGLRVASLKDYDELTSEMGMIKSTLQQTGATVAQANALEAAMNAYVKGAREVIDMAESDPATASAWMTGTTQKYEEMLNQLEALVDIAEKNENDAFAGLDKQSRTGRMVFATSGMIITNLAILFAALVGSIISSQFITMARSITAINRAAEKVDDDHNIRQGKEAGDTARALRTLQHELMIAEEELQRSKAAKK